MPKHTSTSKVCTSCKKELPATSDFFHRHTTSSDGLQFECRECRGIRAKKYYARPEIKEQQKETRKIWTENNPEKIQMWRDKNKLRTRGYRFKHRYKITQEDYNSALKKQNCACAICGKLHNENDILVVDHNHETGEFRGLLCGTCNSALGMFKDSVNFLQKAIGYLGG